MDLAARQQQIGAYFREYREGCGISLREAAGDIMSAAKLSRFERGQIDISTDTAIMLMHRIGMMVSEFVNLQKDNPYAMPGLVTQRWINDTDKVTQSIERYWDAHATDPDTWLRQVAAIKFKCAQQAVDSDFRLNAADEHVLNRFLAYPRHWRSMETELIANCAWFASAEFRQTCWTRMAIADTTNEYIAERLTAKIGLLFAAIKYGEWATFNAHCDEVLKYVGDSGQIYLLGSKQVFGQLLQLIDTWHTEEQSDDVQSITDFFAAVELLGGTRELPFLQQVWWMARHPVQSTHHVVRAINEIDGAADNPDEQPYSGAGLVQLRLRRHLQLNQVAVSWSQSAQSRFENGENQFGFTRTDILKDFLFSGWSDLIHSNYNYHRNLLAHYRGQINDLFFAGKLTEAEAQRIADEYMAGSDDMAQPVRVIQHLELLQYAYTGLPAQIPSAVESQAIELLQKVHRWNTDACLLFSDAARHIPAETGFALWQSVHQIDGDSRLAGDNPGQGDIGIALSIAQAGNKGLAEQMLQSLPQLRHRYTSYWLNDWSVYLALVEAMCKWTINPSEDSVATIEEVLHAMRVASYNLEVNELQDDIHQILATHNH